ncbi:sugar phosphate nucleotidyltransferase [Rickettsia endosymbiont of Polydrusus tereticollis]|uniref:sugar phosphate nucleotidyltransferase n=1 Tax=Rickettsia endosymbiont of Polydrusus tereticollis TaxID=3066251 RepID=UPI003133315B
MGKEVNRVQIIILAAGNGSRMKSDLPKVMHKVGNTPMLEMVLKNAAQVTNDIILVYSEQLKKYLAPYKNICRFVLQKEPLGTAHAVYSALNLIDDNKITIVLYGDHPLITPKVIEELINHLEVTNSAIATLSFERDDPAQCGRIITDDRNNFLEIVEFKNATEEEKKITHCNSGVMAFAPEVLKTYLPEFEFKVGGKEFYLTEIVRICADYAGSISYLLSEDYNLIIGVNTQEELEEANNIFLHKTIKYS